MADKQNAQKDLLKFLWLIMSEKSREELQVEALRYLNSNRHILPEFLRSISPFSTKNLNDANVTPSTSADHSQNKSNDVDITADMKAESSSDQTLTKGRKNGEITKETSNKCQATKKRRKSKYDYIQGDLSHISREPKSRKYRDNSSQGKMTKKKTTLDESKSDTKELAESDDKTEVVRNMMDILLNSKSKHQRDEVVSSLRADPTLRELFMKEKVRMGKLKIPVVQNSCSLNVPEINSTKGYDSCRQDTKEIISSPSGNPSEAEIKNTRDLIQAVQSIIRSKGPDAPYDNIAFNIDHMNFIESPSSLEEPNGDAQELMTTDGTAVTCFPAVPSIGHDTSNISNTSIPFLHILSSDEADSKLAENFYGSNGAIFDNALHEHFQQLACDQYSVNNPFIMNNNAVVSEMQQQHHEQRDINRNDES